MNHSIQLCAEHCDGLKCVRANLAHIGDEIMQEEIDRLLSEVQRARFTERRTEARHPFARPVWIHPSHGAMRNAFSKDLSSQGIGIVSNVAFQPGTMAILEIHSTQGDPVVLRGEVRWCDSYGKGWFVVGWKFIGVAARPVP